MSAKDEADTPNIKSESVQKGTPKGEGSTPAAKSGVAEGPEALFTHPGRFTDVTLKVEERSLFASRYLLAAVSPVFEAMFTHDFKEKAAEEIELPGKKYTDVLELLLQIHPSLRKPMTADLALQLYPLCHEYQMKVEEERCRTAILLQLKQTSVGAEFHRACVGLTCLFDLPEIHEACVKLSVENPKQYFDPFLDRLEDMSMINIRVLLSKMRGKLEKETSHPPIQQNSLSFLLGRPSEGPPSFCFHAPSVIHQH